MSIHRDEAASACPDDAELRRSVANLVGYVPFEEAADTEIAVGWRRESGAWAASVQLHTREGEVIGERELTAGGTDCSRLARAVDLAIAIVLDPPTAGASVPSSRSESENAVPVIERPVCEECPARSVEIVSAPVEVVPASAPSPRIGGHVRVSALGAVDSAPTPVVGLRVEGGIRIEAFSVALGGRVDAESSHDVDEGQLRIASMLGEVSPCFHYEFFFACGVVAIGAMTGSGVNLFSSRSAVVPHALAGAAIGVEWMFGQLGLHARLDGLAAITRVRWTIDEELIWQAPPISGVLTIGGTALFL